MMRIDWNRAASCDPAFLAARDCFCRPSARLNLFGLEDKGKASAILAMAEARRGTAVVVVADILRARNLCDDLRAMSERKIRLIPSIPSRLSARGVVNRDQEMERLFLLMELLDSRADAGTEGAPPADSIFVVPAAVLLEELPPPDEFLSLCLEFRLGRSYSLETLALGLTRRGYERCRKVEHVGQFAIRGEILDLAAFLPDRASVQGLRLSFFDTELEEIRRFDLDNQRSIDSLDAFRLPPARQLLLPERSLPQIAERVRAEGEKAVKEALRHAVDKKTLERLRTLVAEDAGQVEAGVLFAGIERWRPLLQARGATLIDYARMASAPMILDEPLRIRSRLDAAEAERHEEAQSLLLRGQIVASMLSDRFNSADLFRQLDGHPALLAMATIKSSGNGLPAATEFQAYSHPADQYRGREAFLYKDLKKWRQEKWQIFLAVGTERRRERLRELLNEESLTLPLYDSDLSEGFVWPGAKIAALGAVNLFGRERRQRTAKKRGLAIDFFSDLLPGEWVVHETHGIGRYLGLKTLSTDGAQRDYLQIEYQGDDRLYIPTDRLEEIQKYVAGDQSKPKLSKLGGQEWQKQKERAKESIRKLATNLIALYARRNKIKGHAFAADNIWQQEFEDRFPYEDTADQREAMVEIKADMESDKVMDRLLCGDVGFGKTELAFRALFKAVMDGRQGLLLAPTTVLAKQHYDSLLARLGDFPVKVRLLSRFVTPQEQKLSLRELAEGRADIAVGTHRLLSSDLSLARPGILIVDEEQRFGVDHKEKIKERYPSLDVLSLSATPIPRTLHMSMTGIRDISVLEEGPEDRWAVETFVMEYAPEILQEAMLREIARNGQVFYLFNDTRKIAGKALELSEALPGARVAYAHGRMSERQLEISMRDFLAGDYDILVCTTIIESGIDMPNVNTIIVEDADRMGLSQLYQLRGRVGRSEKQAYAYICYRPEKVLSEDAEKRLAAIRDYTELGSGFRIALRDLEVRGAGNLLGGEQSGHLDAVGYDLYCRLLDEALREARGDAPPPPAADCLIELSIDAMVPRDYMADEGQRMDFYRKAIALRSAEGWHDLLDELLDRYGDPPTPVVNLLDLALARTVASELGITRIKTREKDLYFLLQESGLQMERLSLLFQKEGLGGRLLFNAGSKPFLVLKNGAAEANRICEKLRRLFS